MIESTNIPRLIPKNKQQPKTQSPAIEEWTSNQDKKLCSFIILHHKQIFTDSCRQYGIFHYMAKIIKQKNFEQCKNHLLQILKERTQKGRIKKSPKNAINDLILKHQINQHQIMTGIENLIGLPTKQLFLDFTDRKIYIPKNCQNEINLFIKQFFEKTVLKISLFS